MNETPDGFTPVATVADIPPGAMKCVAIDRERVLVANVGGTFHAISDICGHRNAPLSRGRLDGAIVECPLHFATFDIRTGKFLDGPTAADVPAYEVKVESDTVYVKRESRSSHRQGPILQPDEQRQHGFLRAQEPEAAATPPAPPPSPAARLP